MSSLVHGHWLIVTLSAADLVRRPARSTERQSAHVSQRANRRWPPAATLNCSAGCARGHALCLVRAWPIPHPPASAGLHSCARPQRFA
ncbi:MAG: hypothetical protein J3K34DRAFT_413807 [Monoraphidium minutum]|nr:MAG: hypothetical protein J3K34DRAFT_413807 [Monoraphidium minutum]